MQIRAELKKVIPACLWPTMRVIDKYIIYLTYIYLSVKRSYQRKRLHFVGTIVPEIPQFTCELLERVADGSELLSVLEGAGISCLSGRHSVYISDRKAIGLLNSEIADRYPGQIGLKIIKSRQISPDGTPFYTSAELAPASTRWSMRAVGSMAEKTVVSNLLNSEGVAWS